MSTQLSPNFPKEDMDKGILRDYTSRIGIIMSFNITYIIYGIIYNL